MLSLYSRIASHCIPIKVRLLLERDWQRHGTMSHVSSVLLLLLHGQEGVRAASCSLWNHSGR